MIMLYSHLCNPFWLYYSHHKLLSFSPTHSPTCLIQSPASLPPIFFRIYWDGGRLVLVCQNSVDWSQPPFIYENQGGKHPPSVTKLFHLLMFTHTYYNWPAYYAVLVCFSFFSISSSTIHLPIFVLPIFSFFPLLLSYTSYIILLRPMVPLLFID